MKTCTRGAGLAALVLAFVAAGCGQQPKPAPMAESPPGAPAAVALGESATAGPFQVTLSTRNNQVAEDTTEFVADVQRAGQPVTAAKVVVHLEAPAGATAATPDVPLTYADGHYTGRADIDKGGDWVARLEVEAGGTTGTATYAFSVKP